MLARALRASLLAALLLAVGASSTEAVVDPFTYGNPEFCAPEEPLRDFGLSRLPPVEEPPVDGVLSFAPPAVEIYGSSLSGRVMTGTGSAGYGFSENNYRDTVRLDWTVSAQMWKLGGRGRPVREVGSDSIFIGRLDAADQPHITLETPPQRGFYRFDVQFADRNGTPLGAYSQYLKVARPFWKARLGLDRRVYRPGQLVLSRPENLGTGIMTFGESFAVQRLEAGAWVPVPELTPGAWALWLGFATPGGAGRCSALSLPRGVAPGRYRIVKSVGGETGQRRARSYHLATPFRVAG